MAEPLPAIGMTFAEAAEVYQQKLKTDLRFKPRTKGKRRQAIRAILESWPELEELDIRRIRPTQCSRWAKEYMAQVDAKTFNAALEMMNRRFNMAMDMGYKMKNPAAEIEPLPIKKPKPDPPKKKIQLPDRIRLRLK